MIAIIFLMEETPGLQVILLIKMNLLYAMYVIQYKPIYDNSSFEIFNEVCTLLMSSILLMFTDWLSDEFENVRYSVGGYLFITVLTFNIFVNLSMIIASSVVRTYKMIKVKFVWAKYRIAKYIK